jgi:hypothetical protein
MAQLDIEAEILRLNALAEKVTQELSKRARAAAKADADYQRAYYTEFLQASGAMDLRKAIAKNATADLYEAWKIAEALLESAKEAGRNYREQLQSVRSVNANHRALVTG